MCALVCGGQGQTGGLLWSLPILLFEAVFLTELGGTVLARRATQEAPGFYMSLSPLLGLQILFIHVLGI